MQKALFLQEPHKHQAVEQHAGVPAFVAFVVDALDVLEQRQVLVLVGFEELFGGLLHIQRSGNAARGLQHGQTA